MSRTRDPVIDYLKGSACVMMIIAHTPNFQPDDPVVAMFYSLAAFGTILFFAMNGANTAQQVRRYPLGYIVRLNLILFVFGTTFSVIVHPDLYQRYVLEILQIIAMGSIAVALVAKGVGGRPWCFGLIGLLIPLIKFLRDAYWPEFHGAGVLFVHQAYLPHENLPEGMKRFWPGFPVFPWLYTFFWGVFAYSLSQRQQLGLMLTCVGLYVLGDYWGVIGSWREKWDTSIAFWLLMTFKLSLFLWVLRALPARWLQIPGFVTLFGKHSLSFLFVHAIGFALAHAVQSLGQYVAWLVAFLVTWGCLVLLLKWRGWSLFSRAWAWWMMAVLVLVLPGVVLWLPAFKLPAFLLIFACGVLFAKHLDQMRVLLKPQMIRQPV